ncbi:hypothetical protein BV898_04176 [Hypsibius exemplaris]|uniref:Uncharacterized protein n=1 Tax=Hypsibius exemplaris TaxID=2072580 RepID=A0A1W0X383_HYPEX|nr:hypothetical protein BV898_04176 [Hypsibius exemplaris]
MSRDTTSLRLYSCSCSGAATGGGQQSHALPISMVVCWTSNLVYTTMSVIRPGVRPAEAFWKAQLMIFTLQPALDLLLFLLALPTLRMGVRGLFHVDVQKLFLDCIHEFNHRNSNGVGFGYSPSMPVADPEIPFACEGFCS